MPEMNQNEQSRKNEFIIEKIKERPVNKKKLIRRTIITAAMAVIFGLIACFTFLILEPVFSNWLYPEEPPQVVVFPEDQEEMSPEEMLYDNMQSEIQASPEPSSVPLEEEQIQEILSNVTLNKDNYRQLYSALSEYITELNQYMVTVTGIISNVDWLNNVQESRNQASGVIIANNSKELMVLVDYEAISKAERLSMTFYNEVSVEAQVKDHDSATNLAVLSVDLTLLPSDMLENGIALPTLGSSNLKSIVGLPVVALGSPMGNSGSIGYGMVTAVSSQLPMADTNYRLLQTDIAGSQNAGGVLFNMQGHVVGMITTNRTSSDMKNLITAYGISDLKKRVEKMSNGIDTAYLGISGVDVSKEANLELGVPFGAYIREVVTDSPAMLAGIQQGDVLVAVDEKEIENYSDYINVLLELDAGSTIELTIMRQAQSEYREMKVTIVTEEAK